MTTDINELGTRMYNLNGGMSESAYRSIAREALKGVMAAGNPTKESEVLRGAFNGIQAYFMTWSDSMITGLATKFTEAYTK